jgi:hypothetical protein
MNIIFEYRIAFSELPFGRIFDDKLMDTDCSFPEFCGYSVYDMSRIFAVNSIISSAPWPCFVYDELFFGWDQLKGKEREEEWEGGM